MSKQRTWSEKTATSSTWFTKTKYDDDGDDDDDDDDDDDFFLIFFLNQKNVGELGYSWTETNIDTYGRHGNNGKFVFIKNSISSYVCYSLLSIRRIHCQYSNI